MVTEKYAIIKKYGNTLTVPLTSFFKELGLKQNSQVGIQLKNNTIIIKPAKTIFES